MNFPVPMETTSLRGLALAPLLMPRKGVCLITVLELAVAAINVDAMTSNAFSVEIETFNFIKKEDNE